MNRALQFGKWILRPWPLLATAIVAIVHYEFYLHLQHPSEVINKVISATLQVVGGLIVLYSINEDIGTFKHGNLLSMGTRWLKDFPLFRRSVTIHVASIASVGAVGTSTVRVVLKPKNIEERLDQLEMRIEENRQLVLSTEKTLKEKNDTVRVELENATSTNASELRTLRELLGDSMVGSIGVQLFGVLLLVYGAVLNIL